MKITLIPSVAILVLFSLYSTPSWVYAGSESAKFTKGAMYVTGQLGTHTSTATSQPFDILPCPIGAGYKLFVGDNVSFGGTFIYTRWSDYLGCFCGKFTFHVSQPTLDIAYHLTPGKMKGLTLLGGAALGYTFLSVGNELGNDYFGDLRSEFLMAPFVGTHLHLWENISSFLDKVLLTFYVRWSVAGDFSGVSGNFGITFKIK